MQCCNNPDIHSSTYADWCTNCGWEYHYIFDNELEESEE